MRVVLIGRPAERTRLRAALGEPGAGLGLEIAGEAATIAEANAAGLRGDGFLVAPEGVVPPAPSRVDRVDRVDRIDRIDRSEVIHEPLTPREHDVLELLAEGLSNKGIAARLGISDQTVKFHVASICGKLGVANRTEAVRKALRRGLITL
jgi:DNA-binding CsgD family transcriptional regulator